MLNLNLDSLGIEHKRLDSIEETFPSIRDLDLFDICERTKTLFEHSTCLLLCQSAFELVNAYKNLFPCSNLDVQFDLFTLDFFH